MTETDLAYIAGFIDGEGCLSIFKRKPGGTKKTTQYGVKITIANTRPYILEWIQSLFGGYLQKISRSSKNANWADSYQLHFNPKDSHKLLSSIYPYLKLKKSQADLVINFFELRKLFPTKVLDNRTGTLPSCSEYLALQEQYYQGMKALNSKGTSQ